MPRLIVQMSAIRKSFGGSEVLKGIDFALEKGTIHALLGECLRQIHSYEYSFRSTGL